MTETRTALVTGGNRGIGLEVARQLGRLGVLTAIGSRDRAKGDAAAAQLMAEGLEPAVVELDVRDHDSVQSAVAETLHLFGRIDILINNAGMVPGSLEQSAASNVGNVKMEDILATFDANTLGPLRMIQAVLPHMRQEGYGRIVNVSSMLGELTDMGAAHTAYRISKTALNVLTRTGAKDIGPGNIKINSACPGWVKTDMGGANAPRTPAEGAETIVWLGMLDDDGPTGGFFRDKKPVPW